MQSVAATSLSLPSSTHTILGRSRAGDGTTFVIPELKWMFDCGALVEGRGLRQPNVIFLTHTHSDHVLTLAQFCHSREAMEAARKKKPLPIYLPGAALPFVKNYLEAYEAMITMGNNKDASSDSDKENGEGSNNNDSKPYYDLIGVIPHQEVTIHQGGKDFRIKVVECVHRVDCVGYHIWEQQQKLKEEYRGLPGKEIGALKKRGVEITAKTTRPVLCYLGDTTAGVFSKHPEILQQPTQQESLPAMVVECSFLDDDSLENARRTMHMHWDDLEPIVQSNPNTLFVLTHFSLKYSVLFLRNFFNKYPNVHPMLVEAELQQEWQARMRKHGGFSTDCDNDVDQPFPTCNCFVCQGKTETG